MSIKKYNYVYITTNLINGKQYIGDHSTNNLNDNYIGSGLLIKIAIKKYGKHNFKKEILEHFNNKEDAFNIQEKYINQFNTLSPIGYNISPKGGYGIPKSYLSEETKIKIKNNNKGKHYGDKSHFTIFNTLNKKNKTYEEQMIKLYGLEEGIIKAKEYKEKISFITCGENNPMFKKGILIKGEKNGMFGKQHNEQTKQKMRKKRSEETKQKIIIAQKLRRQKEKLFKQNINI
jgi:hypothetical protein